jgi:hypothetical protein
MSRFPILVCIALLATPAFAAAVNPQIVFIVKSDETRAKLIEAANLVCHQALSNDPMGEFGPQSECVQDAIFAAMVRPVASNSVEAGGP